MATEELTEEAKAKWDSGVAAAKTALANSDRPLFIMDEMPGIDIEPDIEAMGWNSVYAGEENQARWKREIDSPKPTQNR